MLFSSSEVAQYISETFEPAWESLRPAPLVTLDFGNGRTVKRTLQGNVATYVCGSDGTVYDVLPGIYTPKIYRAELEACQLLFTSIRPATDVAARLSEYHTAQAKVLGLADQPPSMQAIAKTGGGGKGGFGGGGGGQAGAGFQGNFAGIEGPTTRVIMGRTEHSPPAINAPKGPLADRPELILDAQVNERIRRRSIHERLASPVAVCPDELKKWLFKDVLHADIDDPLLGLGATLNENYPFAEEDRVMERTR